MYHTRTGQVILKNVIHSTSVPVCNILNKRPNWIVLVPRWLEVLQWLFLQLRCLAWPRQIAPIPVFSGPEPICKPNICFYGLSSWFFDISQNNRPLFGKRNTDLSLVSRILRTFQGKKIANVFCTRGRFCANLHNKTLKGRKQCSPFIFVLLSWHKSKWILPV